VRFDDLIDIGFVDVGIPGSLRVDDANRPLLAAIEAAGLVDPYLVRPGQPQFPDPVLGIIPNPGRATAIAGWPVCVGAAVVDAEKYVALVVTHGD
jgi:hypothetical protein